MEMNSEEVVEKVEEIREELGKFSSPLEKLLFLELKARDLKGEALREVQSEIRSLMERVQTPLEEGARPLGEIRGITEFRESDFGSLRTSSAGEGTEEGESGEEGVGRLEEINEEAASEEREGELVPYTEVRMEEEGYRPLVRAGGYMNLPLESELGAERRRTEERREFREFGMELEPLEPSIAEELERTGERRESEMDRFGLEREVKGYLRKIGEL